MSSNPTPAPSLRDRFQRLSHAVAEAVGSVWGFFLAVLIVVTWGVTGPLFGFSDTWQLVINTSTTIVTFLMVFLIQGTQNRDARAVHLKLDELLRAIREARTELVDLENLPEREVEAVAAQFGELHKRAAKEKNPVENEGPSNAERQSNP